MTTFEADEITLEKVRDYVWEIPQEDEMRVPARVLASEALLEEISEDLTLKQLRNTTHLPGIQKYALAMPDAHQGYGFPVGGVAGIDAENGVISPGAVGYDINCLAGSTDVRLSFGRRMKLDDLRERFEDERAVVAGDTLDDSSIRLFTESGKKPVYRVETATGQTIEATADHQFSTPDGMVKLAELEPGDETIAQPFRGLEHEEPEEFTILSEDDLADANPQLKHVLNDRDLLPLRSTDEELNYLLKILGFHLGDGSLGGEGQLWFYGEPNDLESIRDDVRAVGFTPSKVYSRDRQHEIDGSSFEATEYSFKTTSKALRRLLIELGLPEGRKISSGFSAPWYLDRLADWQRALFYGAFFGAEMNAPAAQHDMNLYCPKVSQNRTVETVDSGREFFEDMEQFLADVGVETNEIESFETNSNRDHDTIRQRLGIKNDSENLIRFFSTVGYHYNQDKQRRAIKAIEYLKRKEREIERRERIASEVNARSDGGKSVRELKNEYDINDRFIERSAWSGRSNRPRPGDSFPSFAEFCEDFLVRENLTVTTTIESIERVKEQPVYDIGVEHDAHNLIADGFVVSNCGVRMVRTNLAYEDIQGREQELVDALFEAIPSGLGAGGVVETDRDTLEEVLERGVGWALDEGYAVEDDLTHCEDGGIRSGADADAVSQKAKDRGRKQLGSLGSGNHFLEVQRVTDVYRRDVAEAFGLEEGQIVVLIHCGSRGLGHQVCTDYLRDIEQAHQGLLEQLPDKELAAAPAGSHLAEEYYGAMNAAINFAWTNRQLIMHRTREVFADVFDTDWQDLGMELLYDVAHNIAKKELHTIEGEQRELFVHRKGATRAFPAGHPEVPQAYRDVGQPIIIPGSMGSGSYVLRGGERSMEETFGSTAHGAGRLMSRTEAKHTYWGEDVMDDLRDQQHIYVKAQSGATVAEEAPGVYKDVDEVVRVSDELGIGDRVARTFPVCNIKG